MALQSGWEMYSWSCSVGLGEKHWLCFVSFLKMENVYILCFPLNPSAVHP